MLNRTCTRCRRTKPSLAHEWNVDKKICKPCVEELTENEMVQKIKQQKRAQLKEDIKISICLISTLVATFLLFFSFVRYVST